MHEIVPGVWIGDFAALEDIRELQAHGIQHSINASCSRPTWLVQDEDEPSSATPNPPIILANYHELHVLDRKHADMLQHLNKTFSIICTAVARHEPILINCAQGRSRSATILIDYLMRALGYTYKGALALCRSIRPCISPNAGFRHQLCTRRHLPRSSTKV
jgi:dual specificity phosphatase 12